MSSSRNKSISTYNVRKCNTSVSTQGIRVAIHVFTTKLRLKKESYRTKKETNKPYNVEDIHKIIAWHSYAGRKKRSTVGRIRSPSATARKLHKSTRPNQHGLSEQNRAGKNENVCTAKLRRHVVFGDQFLDSFFVDFLIFSPRQPGNDVSSKTEQKNTCKKEQMKDTVQKKNKNLPQKLANQRKENACRSCQQDLPQS